MTHTLVAKSRLIGVVVLLLISGLSSSLFAGGQNRAGTSAAPELLIPAGARYLSMGGSPVALATGVEAVYWNPAGLDRETKSANAMFSHRTYIADIAYNYLAVSGRFDFGTIGLSLRSLDIGDIPVTTETSPDGTGEIFSPTYFVLGLTYSKQLTDRISIGVSANGVSENFAQVSTAGVAFDVGVQYRDVLAVGGLDVGVAVKNIGPPMKYGGPGLFVNATVQGASRGSTFYKLETAEFDLPSVVEIGVGYRHHMDDMNMLNLSTTFQNNNYAYDEYRFGAEYSYDQMLFLRAGYLFGASSNDARPNIFQDFTLGAGVTFKGNTDISVDYAYVPVKYFDNNHVVSVKVGF